MPLGISAFLGTLKKTAKPTVAINENIKCKYKGISVIIVFLLV